MTTLSPIAVLFTQVSNKFPQGFCALFVLKTSCTIVYLKSLLLAHIDDIAMSFYMIVKYEYVVF